MKLVPNSVYNRHQQIRRHGHESTFCTTLYLSPLAVHTRDKTFYLSQLEIDLTKRNSHTYNMRCSAVEKRCSTVQVQYSAHLY